MKALLLTAIVLSSIIGTVGCTTGMPFGMASLRAPGRSHVQRTYAAPTQVAQNQAPTIPPDQRGPAASIPTMQPVSHAPDSPPLVTLGPNDNFDEMVSRASGVVLVDFYADWCGPCKKQGDILHEMERSAAENHASMIKVNVDQHEALADRFEVSSLPTLMLIKDGKVITRQTGMADRQRVASWLAS